MRILLAEDDPVISDGLARALRRGGYAVDPVVTGVEADTALATQPYDLLILDLGLPRLPGIEVLKRLRARKSAMPVLILTAQDGVEARVRALTRRGTGQPRRIGFGRLEYDQADRMVRIDGEVVEFSAREVGLLEVFILKAGRLVSKDQLVDHLCGWGEEVSNNAIEVYVHRLRKKLEDSDLRIVTVRGLGYCLEQRDEAAASKT